MDAVNGATQANVDVLNAGLFPDAIGESHTFMVRSTAGATRTVTIASASITHVPVPIVTTFNSASGPVGYIQFNDHIATAETPLKNAISQLDNANVTDLILDLRYNGGGYLDLASELAYMIGNTTLTSGRTFERIVFNDKNPSRNPVTGETLGPTPFHSTTQGFAGAGTANQPSAVAQSQQRVHHHGAGHLLGERVHHQLPARRERGRVSHRLDDLRQALWVLSHRQLRNYLLHDPVPWRKRREFR